MSGRRWYSVDANASLDRTTPTAFIGPMALGQTRTGRLDARDAKMAANLRRWLLSKNPGEPFGAIILTQYRDGFAAHYLGPEAIDPQELIRRVVWIGDSMREASQ